MFRLVQAVRRAGPVRLVVTLAIAWLVGFHAILLWGRVTEGSIVRPEVASRWLVTLVIIAALAGLRRWWGSLRFRRASLVALWTIVALLHVGVPANGQLDGSDEWVALVQNTLATFTVILTLIAAFPGAASRLTATGSQRNRAADFTPSFSWFLASPRAPPAS